jgi:PPP family 3-phenylpropionic acid transporter
MREFAPKLWGGLADHIGRRAGIVRTVAWASLASFGGVFFGSGFWWLFAVMAGMSFFWSASLPLVEATTLSHLRDAAARYGHIRLWGSVGFIVAVVGLGYALKSWPVGLLPWVAAALLAGIALFARAIPEAPPAPHEADAVPVWRVLCRPEVLAFIAGGFFMAAAHGAYYTFYSIYLVLHGYGKDTVGWLWALGVVCEIGVFLWMPRLFRAFGLREILLASYALAVLRFLLIGWGVESLALLILAQTLHAATFGSHHAAAVAVAHRFFRGRHQARGQALYNGISFGGGGTAGGLLSGYAWDAVGPAWTFTLAAACALAAWGVAAARLRLPGEARPVRGQGFME